MVAGSANRATKRKPTEFALLVYALTAQIPKGMVTTYKCLSDALRSSPRAIGQALRRNPFAPKVPCHRVLDSRLTLHGFGGKTSDDALTKKRKMLEAEGVAFARAAGTTTLRDGRKVVFADFSRRSAEDYAKALASSLEANATPA